MRKARWIAAVAAWAAHDSAVGMQRARDDQESQAYMGRAMLRLNMLEVAQNQKIIELLTEISSKK